MSTEYTFKKIVYKENPTIDFYQSSTEFLNYVQENYIDTGKIISFRTLNFLDSENSYVEIQTVFRDKQAFDEAANDLEFKNDFQSQFEHSKLALTRLVYMEINNESVNIDTDPSRTEPVKLI